MPDRYWCSPATPMSCPPARRSSGTRRRLSPPWSTARSYGRGAADMKGSLAAMLIACETFVAGASRPPRAHRFPDHRRRGGGRGKRHGQGHAAPATAEQGHRLVPGGRAVEQCQPWRCHQERPARFAGRSAYGARHPGPIAYPQLADNPIHRALPALEALVAGLG